MRALQSRRSTQNCGNSGKDVLPDELSERLLQGEKDLS